VEYIKEWNVNDQGTVEGNKDKKPANSKGSLWSTTE